jgi:aldehyde dehydrogenase (NAD(P)+)
MNTLALDAALVELRASAARWQALALVDKIALLKRVRSNLATHAEPIATLSAERKGVDPHDNMAGDEFVLGPWSAAYGITTLIATLEMRARGQTPALSARALPNGQAALKVFPTNAFETLLVNGLSAEVWLVPGIAAGDARAQIGAAMRSDRAAVALVLGAGNIVSIPILDTLHKLYAEGQVVLLKMNPVNDYASPLIAAIFAPLIEAGYLRMTAGGADVGAYLCAHDGVDEIHITGSARTHDAIVFGAGAEGVARKAAGTPILKKRITSELGGVCPVIIVPGQWTAADLRFQAENIVSQRIYHNGYNCCSSQVIVLPQGWAQAGALMDAVRAVLREQPARHPYYPGSVARAQAQRDAHATSGSVETFAPDATRTLISMLDPALDHAAFNEEAFCPVLAQTELPAPSIVAYLDAAVAFANDRLSGTLSATILIDPRTAQAHAAVLERALATLRYGSIGVNVWAAGAFMLPGAAWGAYPGHTLQDVGSGIGFVHNAYLIDHAQKTVLRGAFREFPRAWRHGDFNLMPKPLWFVTNRNALETAKRVTAFSLQPGWSHMPGLFAAALKG